MPINLSGYHSQDGEEEDKSSLDLTTYYTPEQPTPEAIQPAAPTPDRAETSFVDDIAGAFSSGYRNMKAGVEATDIMLGAATAPEVAKEFMNVIKNQPETPEYYRKFQETFQREGQDISDAEGVWDTTVESFDLLGSAMLESLTNPKGLAYAIAESAAQSLPAIAFGAAGAAVGTAVAPAIGTVIGGASGIALGSYAVEAGAHLKSQIVDHLAEQGKPLSSVTEADIIAVLENPETMKWMESEAQKRGIAVGVVEGITSAFGGKLLTGVAGDTLFKKVAKGAGTMGIESAGEALGETAGQLVTKGPMNYGDIAMEAFTGLGQSVATTAGTAALVGGHRAPTIEPPISDILPAEGDISADIIPEAYQGDNLSRLLQGAAPQDLQMGGDSLSQELSKGAQQSQDIGGQRDALTAVLADEHPGAQQEFTQVMDIVGAHPELGAVMARMQERGVSEFNAVRGMFEAAQRTSHPARTSGQRALLEMGEASLEQAASPLENLRRSSPVVAPIEQPTIEPEAKEVTPDEQVATPIDLGQYADADATTVEPTPAAVTTEPSKAKPSIIPEPTTEEAVEAPAPVAAPTPAIEAAQPAAVAPTVEPSAEVKAAVQVDTTSAVDEAAQAAQTSVLNDLPEPSAAQIEAGNYKKGHVKVQGLDIAIENPKGSERKGVSPDGKEWATTMKDHYGYVKRTKGADGDAVDVFIGDNPNSDKVFVVDQVDPATGKFDEHKVVVGANNVQQAKMFYNRNYAKGWKGAGKVTEMSTDGFKKWLKVGDTTSPAAESAAFLPSPETPVATPKGGVSIGAAVAGKSAKDFQAVALSKPVHKYTSMQFRQRLGANDTVLVKGKPVASAQYYIDSIKAVSPSEIPVNVRPSVAEHISPFSPAVTTKAIGAMQEAISTGATPGKAWTAFMQKGKALEAKPVQPTVQDVKQKDVKPEVIEKVKGVAPEVKHQFTEASRLRNEGLHASLSHMMVNTKNKAHAAILERIIPHISDSVSVKFMSATDPTAFSMRGARAKVDFNPRTGESVLTIKDESNVQHGMYDETIIHEAVHLATMESIEVGKLKANSRTPTGIAVTNLYKIQNKIMKHLNARIDQGIATEFEKSTLTRKILGNVHEVVAWGLTSTMFQSYLKSIPFDGKTSMWHKFTRTLANLLGVPAQHHTALAAILESTNELLEADYRQSNDLREKMILGSTETVSFYKAKETMQMHFELAQLETQRTNLDFERDERTNIKAGKNLKEIDSQIKTLKEDIQEYRAEQEYFSEGEGGVFDIVDRITARPTQMQTIHEKISKWVEEHAVSKESISRYIRSFATNIAAIEMMEEKSYGHRLSAELSPTALSIEAKNAQVVSSIATTKTGLKMIDNQIVQDHDIKGLERVLEPVAKLGNKYLRLWEAWAVVQRSERLASEGREKFILDNEIQAIKDYVDSRPNLKTLFEGSHAEYQKLNRSILQMAIDSGWINEQDAFGGFRLANDEGKVKLKEDGTLYTDITEAYEAAPSGFEPQHVDGWFHDDYIPFNRIDTQSGDTKGFSTAGKIGQVRKGVIGLKGGIGQIPVLENMVKNISFLVSGSMRTVAMRETVKMVKDVAVEQLEDGGIPPMINSHDASELLETVGISSEGLTTEEAQRWQRMFSAVMPSSQDSVVVYDNGRPTYYRVTDPHLLRAIKNIGHEQAKTWVRKVLMIPKEIGSKLITSVPSFIVRNYIREIQNAYFINDKAGINPLETIATATENFGKLLKTDNPEMMAMMAQGAVSFNSYYKAAPDDVRQRLHDMGVKKSDLRNVLEAPWTGAKAAWKVYNRVAVASEYANRLSVRQSHLDAGATEAEANYQALDVLNFSRRGEGPMLEFLLDTTMFLNPRIQSLDRLYRGAKISWKAMAMRASLMAGVSMSLAFWNWEMHGEEMDELKEEDKDMFFHFWIGGEHFRLPKGFEIGQLAGSMPERVVEQMMNDHPEPIAASLRRFGMSTFGMQPPQAIKPILEVAANEDFFRQRPILSLGQQFAMPKQQYDAYTSKLAIDIAQSMPAGMPKWAQSPKQLEHLFKAYTGSVGFLVLDATNTLYSMTGNAPDAPTKQLSQRYLIRDYYRSGPATSSRHVTRFYKMASELSSIAAGLKQASVSSASEYRGIIVDNQEKLQVRKQLNKLSNVMSKLSSRSKQIMASETLSGEEKYTQLQAIIKQRNSIAKQAVSHYWHIFEG